MWGNTWSKPIRDSLPYGTSAGLAFVRILDPALEFDLYADQPWALVRSVPTARKGSVADPFSQSPWLSTSQFINALPHPPTEPLPAWSAPVHEDVTPLFSHGPEPNKKLVQDASALKEDAGKRKKWFAAEANRKAVKIDRSVVVSASLARSSSATELIQLHPDCFRLLQWLHRLQDAGSQAPDRPVVPSRQVLGRTACDFRPPRSIGFKDVSVRESSLQPVQSSADRLRGRFVTLEIVPEEDGAAGREEEPEEEEAADADALGVD